jgi:hypothetical protein
MAVLTTEPMSWRRLDRAAERSGGSRPRRQIGRHDRADCTAGPDAKQAYGLGEAKAGKRPGARSHPRDAVVRAAAAIVLGGRR